jgi:hypothetical protein
MIQVDTTDYRRFIVRMNQINETFTINAATMMKKIAADAFVDIVNMTPVKTGNARANWWPSIDAPSTEEISFDGGGDVESNRATATNHVNHPRTSGSVTTSATSDYWKMATAHNKPLPG